MHPPRRPSRNLATAPSSHRASDASHGMADRLVDWLLTHCPFSTLASLTLLVVGPTLGPIAQPLYVAIPVVLADVAFVLMHRMIASEPTPGHAGHPSSARAK